MVFGDEYAPLRSREFSNPLFNLSLLIDAMLVTSFTIDISPSIYRIGKHAVDGMIGGSNPLDFAQLDRL
jgi:hypothetical protein